MARKRRRRRSSSFSSRRFSSAPRRRRSGRRRGGFGGFGRSLGGFAPSGAIMTTAAAVGGFWASNFIPAKLGFSALQSGWGVPAGKVAVAALGYMLLRRSSPALANGLFIGAATSAGVDALAMVMQRSNAASASRAGTLRVRPAGLRGIGEVEGVDN